MSTFPRHLMILIAAAVLALAFMISPALVAQDATATPGEEIMGEMTEEATDITGAPGDTVSCSSDLIAMLYIAERYFNFAEVHDSLMLDNSEAVDLTQIDRGQFAPAFDSMMGMMGGETFMEDTLMQDIPEMMALDEAEFSDRMSQMADDTDMSQMTALTPATVEGEAEECSRLRAELTRFFTAIAFHDMSADSTAGEAVQPDMEATSAPDLEMTEEMDMEATEETDADMEPTSMPTVTPEADTTDTGEGDATLTTYTAPLSGPQEVPGPGDADATGTATITISAQTNEVCWDINVTNAQLPATGAHIHIGAFGVSGDVVVPLSAPDEGGAASGCTTAEADIVSAILANPTNYYVNVHTSDFPAGALRGQLA